MVGTQKNSINQMNNLLIEVAQKFVRELDRESVVIKEINIGLINKTYKIEDGANSYILQKINTEVFHNPELIQNNFQLVRAHLKTTDYQKEVLEFLILKNGSQLLFSEDYTWRMSKFIDAENFRSLNSSQQAKSAANSLAEFHLYLKDVEIKGFQNPIPEFCNFLFRISEFEKSIQNGDAHRIMNSTNLIQGIKSNLPFVTKYIDMELTLPKRIIHGDPKISNFLFHTNSVEVHAIIDMDTLMTGSVLYDFGDMVRSFTNSKAEDDSAQTNLFSSAIYTELYNGYIEKGKEFLTKTEMEHLPHASVCVPLIQSMRFLTDYLNMDVYYQVNHSEQNFKRAMNQFCLFEEINEYLSL